MSVRFTDLNALLMVDIVDAVTRSRMMASIKSRDTKPEVAVRRGLHARGFRFRLHASNLSGNPDIVLPKWRVVIFVHGCFWHQHGCAYSKLPQSRTEFWTRKLAGNKLRDAQAEGQLLSAGWRVVLIWECATRGKAGRESLGAVLDAIASWIRDEHAAEVVEFAIGTKATLLSALERKTLDHGS